jgi:hypothetical protein
MIGNFASTLWPQLSSIRQEYHTSEAQRCRTEPREKTTQIFEAM